MHNFLRFPGVAFSTHFCVTIFEIMIVRCRMIDRIHPWKLLIVATILSILICLDAEGMAEEWQNESKLPRHG